VPDRRGRGRGARAQRAGHDPAGRNVLPGRRPGRPRACTGGRRWFRRGACAVIWAVVPAAGQGSRYGGEVPKQYLEVAGEPLLAHTLRALLSHPGVAGAAVVLSDGDPRWPGWSELEGKPVLACVGGEERADSVLAGLEALPAEVRADDFVLVHDAARPNLHRDDLGQLLERGRADPVGAIL